LVKLKGNIAMLQYVDKTVVFKLNKELITLLTFKL
jgi:hypothetical protein